MKETIGAKGGSNDRRKTAIITRSKKKKSNEDNNIKKKKLKELEKKVRKTQVINFFTSVPLVISASVVKTFLENCNIISKNEKNNSERLSSIEEKDIEEKVSNDNNVDEKEIPAKKEENIDKLPIVVIPINEIVETKLEKIKLDKEETKQQEEVINKDIDKKIIETYGEELKKVRTELKEIAYNNFSKSSEYEAYSNEAKLLLDKLNLVIKRLDDCSDMIETSKLGDENYYYELALKYISEFNNKSVVDDIKDSELYIEISDKLKTIDKMKEELRKKVLEKQMDIDISNDSKEEKEDIDEFEYEELKKDIDDFQSYQEEIVEEIDIKSKDDSLANSKEEQIKKDDSKLKENERLEKESKVISELDIAVSKARALNKYCESLLAIINKPNMKRPSVRSTKAVATTTLIAAYFMKKILRGRLVRKRKKLRKVDYSKYMESNLSGIENAIELIKEASNKLDDLISDIKRRFSEYLYLKEFQDLLRNIEEVKSNIKEKEYEINNIKNNYVNGLHNQRVK